MSKPQIIKIILHLFKSGRAAIPLADLRRLEANNKNTICSIGTKGRLGIKKNS